MAKCDFIISWTSCWFSCNFKFSWSWSYWNR